MPLKTPHSGSKWYLFGGMVLGFVAVLGYSGNLNRPFFDNVFRKRIKDESKTAMKSR